MTTQTAAVSSSLLTKTTKQSQVLPDSIDIDPNLDRILEVLSSAGLRPVVSNPSCDSPGEDLASDLSGTAKQARQQQQHKQQQQQTQSPTVLVTGVEGYVAGVLVQRLLQVGCHVHGTHILPDSEVESLRRRLLPVGNSANDKVHRVSDSKLKLFHANLLDPYGFDEAMEGCEIVFHTASPFLIRHNLNVEQELIRPAVEGTRNVLDTANRQSAVRRVILTSSVGAVYADATDTHARPLDERDWNRSSTFTHQPYFLSKTLAELEAWVIAGGQTQWTLVVLNPGMVIGPGTHYHPHSESFRLIKKLMSGTHYSTILGCPPVAMPVVDVRDVAAAHIIAAWDPSIRGRCILVAENSRFDWLAQYLVPAFPEYPIPRHPTWIPTWIVWLVTPYLREGHDRAVIWRNIGRTIQLDNQKSTQVLGLRYRPVKKSMQDMFRQMIQAGAVQPGRPLEYWGTAVAMVFLALGVGIVIPGLRSVYVD